MHGCPNDKIFRIFSLKFLDYQRQIKVPITQDGENNMKNGTIYKYEVFLENDSIPINQMHNKSPSLTA